MASSEYKLAVVNGTSLSLSLSGPAGPSGATNITTSTATNLTGFISGNGTAVSGATAATTAATGSTLVLRNAEGRSSFGSIIVDGSAQGMSGIIDFFGDTAGATSLFRPLSMDDNNDYLIELPLVSGTLPAVPPYASLALANAAALGAGTFFWDTTLKKLRVTTA